MPSLVRFLAFLGLLATLAYAGMFALVSLVEPTEREFVVTVPQDRMLKRVVGTPSAARKAEVVESDRLQSVEPDRLARELESLHIKR